MKMEGQTRMIMMINKLVATFLCAAGWKNGKETNNHTYGKHKCMDMILIELLAIPFIYFILNFLIIFLNEHIESIYLFIAPFPPFFFYRRKSSLHNFGHQHLLLKHRDGHIIELIIYWACIIFIFSFISSSSSSYRFFDRVNKWPSVVHIFSVADTRLQMCTPFDSRFMTHRTTRHGVREMSKIAQTQGGNILNGWILV